jgi:predicted nuclease of predicted toxin-antitoxin system
LARRPPKVIAIEFENCSNKILWKKLNAKIYDAIDKLIYGDLDIFDIK